MNLETQKYIEKLRKQGLTDDEIVEYMSLKAMQKEYQDEKEQELQKMDCIDTIATSLCIASPCVLISSSLFDDVYLKSFVITMGCLSALIGFLQFLKQNQKLLKCHHESPYDHQIALFEESKNMNHNDKVKTR